MCTASSDHYASDPAREQIAQGADLLVNISASPFELGKPSVRRSLVSELAKEGRVPVLYCNQVGGNDDLVFDGGSFAVNAEGELIAQGPSWVAASVPVRVGDPAVACLDVVTVDPVAEVLSALELGLRDYARKCGFTDVVVGLSGGIDSAVTAAIAARALGPERVVGLIMPSPHSSDHSLDDARALADNLGVRVHTLPIGPTMEAFDEVLDQVFEGQGSDVTEENIQARLRGSLSMAYSNKFGHLVLTTGNKSELAVGYCTLYGDMCGGLALLSDVPKMMVYALAHLMNSGPDQVIPKNTIHKPPSAELRPGQQDSDSLPPYEVLDGIIEAYVEDGKDEDAIVQMGFSKEVVKEVVALIHRNEYKRRQAAPGLKVTSKAFGVGRRFPIAHRRG